MAIFNYSQLQITHTTYMHIKGNYIELDFIHSLYIHYIIRQSEDYVYGLMTGLFAWISWTDLSRSYFIIEEWAHIL